MGNKIFDFANNFLISKISPKTSFVLALYQSSELIISILLNLIGGAISDFTSKKNKIVIISDFLSGIFVLSILFLQKTSLPMSAVIILVNILLSIISSFNAPSAKALIKHYIDKDEISKFNSCLQIAIQIIKVITPIFTISLIKVIGYRNIILINAFTFFLSSFCEYNLKSDEEIQFKSKSEKKIIKNIVEGIQYLLQQKKILNLIVTSSLVNFFLAGYNLFLPYSRNLFESSIDPYAIFLSAEAAGGMIGGIIALKIISSNYSRKSYDFLIFSGLFIVLYYFVMKLFKNIIIAMICIVLFNLFLTIYNISFFTGINEDVDSDYIGRIFSIVFTAALAFMPIGSFVFSWAFSVKSMNQYLFIGIGVVAISMVAKKIYIKGWFTNSRIIKIKPRMYWIINTFLVFYWK